MELSAGDVSRSEFALIEHAFARASGAPLVPGNDVSLLKDAGQNYPAWLEAIGAARRTIHFESYIIHDDETGQEFARALAARARAGVRVRLIYDWLRSARPRAGSGESCGQPAWRSAASILRAC
jgi:cardiolipin synthase